MIGVSDTDSCLSLPIYLLIYLLGCQDNKIPFVHIPQHLVYLLNYQILIFTYFQGSQGKHGPPGPAGKFTGDVSIHNHM